MQSACKMIGNERYVRRALIVFTLITVAAIQPAAGQDLIIKDLGALPGEYNYSNALGINERDQVVGFSITAGGYTHACLFENGVVTDLGTFPGGSYSSANAINNRGQVIGTSSTARGEDHAFLFEHGVMTDLGTLPGGNFSTACGINEHGQVGRFLGQPARVHSRCAVRERGGDRFGHASRWQRQRSFGDQQSRPGGRLFVHRRRVRARLSV